MKVTHKLYLRKAAIFLANQRVFNMEKWSKLSAPSISIRVCTVHGPPVLLIHTARTKYICHHLYDLHCRLIAANDDF